ncbi:E3 SUMO-protein ligase PIAS4 [Heterocephalus glaber]|uniref:E3 SUMO-protein ligase PIAS4 n=1 Tax=Heterocephalus glaber TaxID=10181 RepID=G5BZB7_HETGA|nr:E3 SUMO-protein ligase PIAS4 [Heterocephalus glaber]
MVMSFRVSDLQMLLGFVGRSKSGLKHELVTRALQLVQFDCSPELFKKIKELYETRYAKKGAEPGPQPHRPLDPLTVHSAYERASAVPRTPLSGPNIDYPVLYGKYLNGLGRLPAKTLKPEVRLVKLPFFNMLDELLKPTELGECCQHCHRLYHIPAMQPGAEDDGPGTTSDPHRPLDPLTVHSAYERASAVPRTPLSGPNIDYPVLYGKYLNGLGRLPAKTLKPEVRLVKLPFFNMLDELLKPTELGECCQHCHRLYHIPAMQPGAEDDGPGTTSDVGDAHYVTQQLSMTVPQNNEKLQESPCIFALTPRQVELIRNSRELQPGVKAVQVVLRICYSDTSCPQEDQYPPNIAVKVNHSYCSVPGYYPSNKPGVEPKRPCRPINLTHLMYLSSATNRITVTWGNYGKSYSAALYLVRQLTSAELLQRLETIGVEHPELCKALVKEKLRLDPDSEIATTGVRVSLICPLVKMRLSVPCRAETCAHLQCFDAVFYLQMNEKKPTWMCPVCDKPAPYDQLIIDGLAAAPQAAFPPARSSSDSSRLPDPGQVAAAFSGPGYPGPRLLSKILSECEDADEIEFLADGSWCPIRAEKERSCSPQGPILVLGTSDTNGLVPTPNVNGSGGMALGSTGVGVGLVGSMENGKLGADVVDLTLDSSSSSEEEEEEDEEEEEEDEEGPRPKRRCPLPKGLVPAC